MSNQPTRKPTKIERERAMYAKMGMKHPKDVALDVALENLKGFCRKMTPPPKEQDRHGPFVEGTTTVMIGPSLSERAEGNQG